MSGVFGVGVASAAPGSLVSGFGSNGNVVTAFGDGSPATSFGGGVVAAPNGDIYEAGSAIDAGTMQLYVARFLPGGSLDPSFGTQGVTYVNVGAGSSPATATPNPPFGSSAFVALTPAGNPVVLTNASLSGSSSTQLAVLELTQSGQLDPAFGSGGAYEVNVGGVNTTPGGLAVQSDGDIVLTGGSDYGSGQTEFFAERLTAAGAVDTSFGTGGFELLQLGQDNQYSMGTAVVAQSNGDLAFSANADDASSDEQPAVVRLTSNGQPDLSFGDHGIARVGSGLGGIPITPSLVVLADGGYAVTGESAGSSSAYGTVTRLTSSGQIDAGFGSGGTALLPTPNNSVTLPMTLLLQGDGKLVATGLEAGSGFAPVPFVTRLNSDGTLDTSFGSNGSVSYSLPGAIDTFTIAATQTPDGNVVLSGMTEDKSTVSSFLQEVSLDTPPTVSFAYAPSSVQAGTPVQFVASAVAGPGESISQVSWDFGDGNFADGTGTGVSHTFTAAGTYTVRVRATDAFGLSTISTQSITVAAAPVTVTPQIKKARPTLRVISVRDVHGKIKVKLSCKGAACKIAANLTTLEHLISGKTASLSSAGHGKHTKTVKISAAKLKLAAGKTRTFTLKLNRTGKRLLATFHHIPAKGSFKLTNTRPAKTIHRTLRIS